MASLFDKFESNQRPAQRQQLPTRNTEPSRRAAMQSAQLEQTYGPRWDALSGDQQCQFAAHVLSELMLDYWRKHPESPLVLEEIFQAMRTEEMRGTDA